MRTGDDIRLLYRRHRVNRRQAATGTITFKGHALHHFHCRTASSAAATNEGRSLGPESHSEKKTLHDQSGWRLVDIQAAWLIRTQD